MNPEKWYFQKVLPLFQLHPRNWPLYPIRCKKKSGKLIFVIFPGNFGLGSRWSFSTQPAIFGFKSFLPALPTSEDTWVETPVDWTAHRLVALASDFPNGKFGQQKGGTPWWKPNHLNKFSEQNWVVYLWWCELFIFDDVGCLSLMMSNLEFFIGSLTTCTIIHHWGEDCWVWYGLITLNYPNHQTWDFYNHVRPST